ncbi:MAG: hypothetical protein QM733_17980 [Ilumatobacteraceae bacterium]
MATSRGPILIDTDVYGAELTGSPLAVRYQPIIAGRPAFASFQTEAELRFGARLRGWGSARMLEAPSPHCRRRDRAQRA